MPTPKKSPRERLHGSGQTCYIDKLKPTCDDCLAYNRECGRRNRLANPEQSRADARKRMQYWRSSNPGKAREKARNDSHAWRIAHPDKATENERKRRARQMNVPSDGHTRLAVWQRDNGICQECDAVLDFGDWHEDHIVPIVAGGPDTMENCRVTCPPCNLRKGARLVTT